MRSKLASLAAAVGLILTIEGAAFAQTPGIPKDVQDFSDRAEGCIHFGGEVPENPRTNAEKQRAAQVAKKIKELCTGNDKRLAALKSKYRDGPAALKKLAETEELLKESGALD